ncbi:hypothetical protein FS749_005485 [Ceratobasidium sp. UAMH 11750]|nr:hypothetical protein FS749_005485 [Ceratobasidium sp. UAMH 11750]
MDALRSIPDSVAAARAGLRNVVREILNGRVQISYIGPDTDPTPTRMTTAPSASSSAVHGSGPVPNDKLPSPWGFVTSGYALGLLLMAIILNRIAHVVVPPRQTGRRRQPRRIWHALFPINVSATHTRLVSRAPSIALLGTALFLLLIALVQAAAIWEPLATKSEDGTWSGMWYVRACRWAAGKEMSFVCWTTYIAVCVAMVMNTLTTGLEGGGAEGSHSFNLFGYSFLLHIYASPIMHTQTSKQPLPTEDTPPSRPDKHVLITIILPLLQVCRDTLCAICCTELVSSLRSYTSLLSTNAGLANGSFQPPSAVYSPSYTLPMSRSSPHRPTRSSPISTRSSSPSSLASSYSHARSIS